ncbi:MAG: YihY/virulence factor BrkB family protein [Cytophagaceae bacterium]|nr:YihY/virulence factor BrkB family protein [Cytophagaceae bacterium]
MLKHLQTLFFASKAYDSIISKVKRTYITRHRVSLYRFLQILFAQIRKDNIPERASSMAFNFVLSVFPAIIFIFTLIPYIPIEDLQAKVMFALKNMLPISMYNGVAAAIYDIIHIPHGGLLSFGFFFAVFTATNGIMAMITAFNRCYKSSETRNYFKRIITAITIVFFLVSISFLSIFAAVATRHYLQEIHMSKEFLYYVVVVLKNLFFYGVFYVAVSLIYFVAPAVSVRWKFFSSGSLISSLLIVLFTLGFSTYINSFDSYNKLYGSIGAFIAVMLWFYAISIGLLIGFEINASLDLAKRELSKKVIPEPLEAISAS